MSACHKNKAFDICDMPEDLLEILGQMVASRQFAEVGHFPNLAEALVVPEKGPAELVLVRAPLLALAEWTHFVLDLLVEDDGDRHDLVRDDRPRLAIVKGHGDVDGGPASLR